jgi:hypothetical protein
LSNFTTPKARSKDVPDSTIPTPTGPPVNPAPFPAPAPSNTLPTGDEFAEMNKTLDAIDAINPEVLTQYAGFFAKFQKVKPKLDAWLALHSSGR